MTLVSDIAAYMVTNSIGTSANIFTTDTMNFLPDSPDAAVFIDTFRGSPSDLTLDLKKSTHPGLQILVRGVASPAGHTAARATAASIDTLLDGLVNTTIGSTKCILIKAQSPPAMYGEISKGRQLWEQNFSVVQA